MYTLKDIKPGMRLVLRNGSQRVVLGNGTLVVDPACGAKYAGRALYLDEYCSKLRHPLPGYDIMAVWDPNVGPLWQRTENTKEH